MPANTDPTDQDMDTPTSAVPFDPHIDGPSMAWVGISIVVVIGIASADVWSSSRKNH